MAIRTGRRICDRASSLAQGLQNGAVGFPSHTASLMEPLGVWQGHVLAEYLAHNSRAKTLRGVRMPKC